MGLSLLPLSSSVGEQALEERDAKGESFAVAGFGADEDVAALEEGGDGEGLDARHGGEAELAHGAQRGLAQPRHAREAALREHLRPMRRLALRQRPLAALLHPNC